MDELLTRMTSRELSEWMAYERVAGPVDDSWRDEAIARQVEFLHDILYLAGQQFTDKTHRKGPIEKREQPYPRPREVPHS